MKNIALPGMVTNYHASHCFVLKQSPFSILELKLVYVLSWILRSEILSEILW